MKIKRLIALSITAAALAGGAAFAQDTHFDGYAHNPIAMHNDQQSSLWNQKRDLKKEEQIRKKREQEEKSASNGKRKNVSGQKQTAKRKSPTKNRCQSPMTSTSKISRIKTGHTATMHRATTADTMCGTPVL